MAFCRITGRSRGLPKPNYFPLLPPISPSAAKRYCRITGKSYGLPSHNFIPVILTANLSHKVQCKITTHGSETAPLTGLDGTDLYGQRKHVLLPDYRYLFPRWDDENNNQKELLSLLESAQLDENTKANNYVYRVEERSCNLVFPAELETAIRDGDVRDIMLAKDSDRILLKMRKGTNVSVEMCDWRTSVDHDDDSFKCAPLCDGEGPRPEIILERQREEKKKKKQQKKMRHMAKVFEGKHTSSGTAADNAREDHQKRANRVKSLFDPSALDSLFSDKQKFLNQIQGSVRSCSDLVKPLIESWDWKTYEQMANSKFKSKLAVNLPNPINIEATEVKRECPRVSYSELLENTIGFDAIPHVTPLVNYKADNIVAETVITSIRQLSSQQLADTENAIENLETDIEQLPTVEDLPEILKNIKSGKFGQLAGVTGLKLDIHKAHETFIAGQNIGTPTGTLFVPGQTVATPVGPVYVPGITVNTPGIGISFIPGLVTKSACNDETFEFVAGQIIEDKFVAGQTLGSPTEPRFCEGQTIVSPDGQLKFVAGIVNNNDFVCGQTLITSEGDKFMPGQTVTTDNGDLFFAGRSIKSDENVWTFVEGQDIATEGSKYEFVPGKTVKTGEGSKFVPGQTAGEVFIPGIQKVEENGESKFIPGLNIDTEMGQKFIQGMVTESEFGPIFMPGLLEKNAQGLCEFAVAKNMKEVIAHDCSIQGMVIDPNTCEVAGSSFLNVFGYMIQTDTGGIEFYPEKVPVEQRLAGKAIPGRLFKQHGTTKFIPGIMSDDRLSFIAGQIVSTDQGDQFVPGQVVETEDGLKFMPGQVIETKTGCKFVPGQTFETKDGPRFVPGQIVQTRGGPTFIPGQVIFTDGCERFVPGQVVDTEYGPRFVPGRVLEEGDSVTFIPGQIVETAEGPRFVAPDLMDNEEGEQEFSVQSFLVSPEELKLMKPNGYAANENGGDLSVDATLIRQLSEAGMSVGRQIEMSAVDLVLQSTKDDQCVKNIEKAFSNMPKDVVLGSIEAVKSVIGYLNGEADLSLPTKPKNIAKNINPMKIREVEEVLKNVYRQMSGTKKSFYEILEKELLSCAVSGLNLEDISIVIQANALQLVKKLHSEIEIEQGIQELASCLDCNKVENMAVANDMVLPVLRKAINDDNVMCSLEALMGLKSSEVIQEITNLIRLELKSGAEQFTNRKLIEIVIGQVQETINRQIEAKCLDKSTDGIHVILKDTIQLAKALEVAPELINQIVKLMETDTSVVFGQIQSNPQVAELVSRIFLIREIIANSEMSKDEESKNLMQQLRSSPYSIRSNSYFIDVFRKSGCLLSETKLQKISPENAPLQSSHELPHQVLFNDNPLVIENYLIKRKTKTRDALVIIKDSYKAVVPRHLSHAVLTGKCSYTLLDEHGIRHFEPLNVLEALNMVVLKKMPSIKKRFSTYQQCKVKPDATAPLRNMNGFRNALDRSVSEETENKIADSDEIDGILAMASSCNTFGKKPFDSSPSHSLSLSGVPVGLIHTALLPQIVSSYRYF